MTSDLLNCDSELREALSGIERELQDAATCSDASQRRKRLQGAARMLESATRLYEIFLSETRHLPSSDDRATYEQVGQDHSARLHAMRARHREIERGAGATAAERHAHDERTQTIANYASAVRIQDDSLAVLRRAQMAGAQAEAIATTTAEQLSAQTERLQRMEEGVGELQHAVKRAKRELIVFFRTAATDKCFIILFALVVLGVVFVVVWHGVLKEYLATNHINPFGLVGRPPGTAPAA